MDILSNIPHKKWTKGMMLACLGHELSPFGYQLRDKSLVYVSDDMQVTISVDVHPWQQDPSGQTMDAYITFFAEPTTFPFRDQRLWPAAMDMDVVKRRRADEPRSNYLLTPEDAYQGSQLQHDFIQHAAAFFEKLSTLDGYFAFLLDSGLVGAPQMTLHCIALAAADALQRSADAEQASTALHALIENGLPEQRQLLQQIITSRAIFQQAAAAHNIA